MTNPTVPQANETLSTEQGLGVPLQSEQNPQTGSYSTPESFVPEYRHQEVTQKQDHEHKREMADLKHRHELEKLDKNGGDLGKCFGLGENQSKGITFVLMISLMIIMLLLILTFYNQSPHSQFVELVWNSFIPVLTLALGYIFGKE